MWIGPAYEQVDFGQPDLIAFNECLVEPVEVLEIPTQVRIEPTLQSCVCPGPIHVLHTCIPYQPSR